MEVFRVEFMLVWPEVILDKMMLTYKIWFQLIHFDEESYYDDVEN